MYLIWPRNLDTHRKERNIFFQTQMLLPFFVPGFDGGGGCSRSSREDQLLPEGVWVQLQRNWSTLHGMYVTFPKNFIGIVKLKGLCWFTCWHVTYVDSGSNICNDLIMHMWWANGGAMQWTRWVASFPSLDPCHEIHHLTILSLGRPIGDVSYEICWKTTSDEQWTKPWLFTVYRGWHFLPSYIGIIIHHYKNPY